MNSYKAVNFTAFLHTKFTSIFTSILGLHSLITQDEELDTRIGKTSVVMRALHYSVVMKRELSEKAKLSIFKTVFVPLLTYGHWS